MKKRRKLRFPIWPMACGLQGSEVVSFLHKGISQDVLAHVLGLEHAAEIWAAVVGLFYAQS
jgi:hypothetical protein